METTEAVVAGHMGAMLTIGALRSQQSAKLNDIAPKAVRPIQPNLKATHDQMLMRQILLERVDRAPQMGERRAADIIRPKEVGQSFSALRAAGDSQVGQ
jgi:hypothetical protein